MPTRLLLEGRDLEELLAQVRDEHGPEAKIVSAEKIRSGGVGGLFGHQKFELTVEIPDSSPSASPEAPTVAMLTIEDLAAMADAAELRGEPPTSEGVLAAAGATPAAAVTAPDGGTEAAAFAEALAMAQDAKPPTPAMVARGRKVEAFRPATVPPPPAKTATPVPPPAAKPLKPLTAAEPQKPHTAAEPQRPHTATEPQKPHTAAAALNRLLQDSPPEDVATPSVRPFRPTAATPVARLGMRTLNATAAQPDTKPADAPSPQFTLQETTVPVDVSEAVATIERPRTGDSAERLAATYGPAAAQATAAPSAQPAATNGRTNGGFVADKPPTVEKPERAADRTALPRRLQSLGVPADIAFRATALDTYAAIVEAFQTLPAAEPAPDGPGETLVVIGESTHAVEVARSVAGTLRLEFDEILFAGRNAVAAGVQPKRRITGGHDARSWAKRLRKADAPSIVAVEAALDESGWAGSIVEAIRPAAVWVVVDASRKTSDVAHHLQGLRRVDALALRSTLSSGDPASPLSLRVPVAMLDGRTPTPYAWAAMLCERLSLVGG